ncbi:hypothetical protein OF83DRAFT_299519 [Amylostereum chailletii]|nr:hypothetical protein OF83DRAFT_299519 [Amylostereum chailletii]
MPPLEGEDHTRTAGFVTSPTHFGQHHPFYVEHEGAPSVASSTATHAPIAPSFPSHSLPPAHNYASESYYLKHEGTSRSVLSQPGFVSAPPQPPILPSLPSLRPHMPASNSYPPLPPPHAAHDAFAGPSTLYQRQSGDVGLRPDARAVGSLMEPSRGLSAYQSSALPHVKLEEDQEFEIGLSPSQSASMSVASQSWSAHPGGEHPYGGSSVPRGYRCVEPGRFGGYALIHTSQISWDGVQEYGVSSMTPQDPRYRESDPEQVFPRPPM